MFEKKVYRLFGIPVWSVTRELNEKEVYEKIAKMVFNDLDASLRKARGQ